MFAIHVFDPSLCCSSGVCGADVHQALVDFNAAATAAHEQGIEVVRHNLANAPLDFAREPVIKQLLAVKGAGALPAIVVDGTLALVGRYPSLEELRRWAREGAGLPSTTPTRRAGTRCCEGSGCC